MIVVLENLKCPSWNVLNRRVHWTVRANERDNMASYITEKKQEIKRKMKCHEAPFEITIEAHFKEKNRRDPDNLYVKPLLDALVKIGVLTDDSGDVVESLTLKTKRKQEKDQVIITII